MPCWSQRRFAEVLGVNQSTLARWERRERWAKREFANQVEGTLGEFSSSVLRQGKDQGNVRR